MNPYFGAPWDAPILDGARQVPTPVGETCLGCLERVEDGDRGLIMPLVTSHPGEDGGYAASPRPVHLECHLRSTLSHVVKQCECYVPGRSLRDEARATLVALNERRAEIHLGPL